jgi:hypothetical protein
MLLLLVVDESAMSQILSIHASLIQRIILIKSIEKIDNHAHSETGEKGLSWLRFPPCGNCAICSRLHSS